MQSSAVGENVITDLRTILEEALERIKTEIFGPGQGPQDEPGAQASAQPSGEAPAQPGEESGEESKDSPAQ
jgi:hypothetical protein